MGHLHATMAPELLHAWLVVDCILNHATIPSHIVFIAVATDVWRVLGDLFEALLSTMRNGHERHLIQSRRNLVRLLLGKVTILDAAVGTALGHLLHRRNGV